MMNMRHSVSLVAMLTGVTIVLLGCSLSGPPPQTYVLGDVTAPDPVSVSKLNTPTVEVRPIRVPDYLDTTDIVTRGAGGLIVPSQSGRWGERLSIGFTRAVTAELTRKLPRFAVMTSVQWGEPRWQVRIQIDSFDVRAGESSTLVATWSVMDERHHKMLAEQRVVLTANGAFRTDAQVVAVMGHQVDELAERVASSLADASNDGDVQRRSTGKKATALTSREEQ